MNQLELEYARKRKNKTKADMAAAIGKSVVSYAKKERGDVKFSDEEKIIVATVTAPTTTARKTIAEYKKGTGKQKGKTYKIGGDKK